MGCFGSNKFWQVERGSGEADAKEVPHPNPPLDTPLFLMKSHNRLSNLDTGKLRRFHRGI